MPYRGKSIDDKPRSGTNAGLDGEDSVENIVPDLARHPKAEIKVLVVMCKVVLFHLPEVGGQACVMHTVIRLR